MSPEGGHTPDEMQQIRDNERVVARLRCGVHSRTVRRLWRRFYAIACDLHWGAYGGQSSPEHLCGIPCEAVGGPAECVCLPVESVANATRPKMGHVLSDDLADDPALD